MSRKILPFTTLLLLMLVTGIVSAHSSIERTSPSDGDVLTESPSTLQVWFTDPLIPDTEQISVTNTSGKAIPLANIRQDTDDPKLLQADFDQELQNDTYIITVSALANDGHRATGTFTFRVNIPSSETSDAKNASPAYAMLGLFGVVLGAAVVGGYFWTRQSFEITRPDSDIEHINLT